MSQKLRISSENQMAIISTEITGLGLNLSELFENVTRCSAIAERPRCRVRYSFSQKWKTGTGRQYFRSYCSLLFKFWTFCVFEPLFGGLGTTYDDHLRLIGKRTVDFPLVLIFR